MSEITMEELLLLELILEAEGEEWVLLKALMLLSSLGMQNVYFEVLLIAHLNETCMHVI